MHRTSITGSSIGANAAASTPLPAPPASDAAAAPAASSNKFGSIFSGLKKEKEEKVVDYK